MTSNKKYDKPAFVSLLPIAIVAAALSCQTTESPILSNSLSGKQERTVSASTKVPNPAEDPKGPVIEDLILRFPDKLLTVATITRPESYVYEGPGPSFQIHDKILSAGAEVVVLAAFGVWRKILVPGEQLVGWVHFKGLSKPSTNSKELRVAVNELPSVFAGRDIAFGFQYPEKKSIKLNLPKGMRFLHLTRDREKTLAYILETNSVVWLKNQDAQ